MNDVFLYQRVLPHYRIPVYARVNEALGGRLVLCHGDLPARTGLVDGGEAPFRRVRMANRWVGGQKGVWQPFWEPFRRYGRPAVVLAEASPRILSLGPLWAWCRMRGIPLALWGITGSVRRDVFQSDGLRDRLYRGMYRATDAYITYTDGQGAALARAIGREKVFVARNTLDMDTLFALRRGLEPEGREAVRARLGMTEDYYLLFIGRLEPVKQLGMFVDVVAALRQRGYRVGGVVVGGGPEREALEARAKEVGGIVFTGPISEWERSAPYLYAADALVVPGTVGLAMHHAFAFGLPVVTRARGTDGPFQPPETEYLTDGETGYMVDGGADAMADAVERVLADRDAFRARTVAYAERELTLDRYVAGVKAAVDYLEGRGSPRAAPAAAA